VGFKYLLGNDKLHLCDPSRAKVLENTVNACVPTCLSENIPTAFSMRCARL